MHYIVTNGNAYAIDHPQDAIYGAPVLEDGNVDWDGSYDIAWDHLDEEEREYIAHVFIIFKRLLNYPKSTWRSLSNEQVQSAG